MKKVKLKKDAQHKIFIGIAILLFLIFGISGIVKVRKELNYQKTYESKLINYGYSFEEATDLINIFSDQELDSILAIPKNSKIIDLGKEKYFIFKNLERYLNMLSNKPNTDLKEIVALVNVNRDYEFYTHDLVGKNTDASNIIVNKYYILDENYVPDDLVNISLQYAYAGHKIKKEANDAYVSMWHEAKDNGIQLIVNSSYRSYAEQKDIYDSYIIKYGQKKTDEMAAKPGYSEHQSGLVIDVFEINNQKTSTFKNSPAYEWLKNNAYNFGFIERYPENKENITGYSFESWHWRYVGKDVAKIIHDEDITYDEYYAYYVENQA